MVIVQEDCQIGAGVSRTYMAEIHHENESLERDILTYREAEASVMNKKKCVNNMVGVALNY